MLPRCGAPGLTLRPSALPEDAGKGERQSAPEFAERQRRVLTKTIKIP